MSRRVDDEQPQGATHNDDHAEAYEIRVMGHLDAHWSAWFDGLRLNQESDGTTTIQGRVADQAALHGLLQRVRDLGLELVSVLRLESGDR